MTVQEIYLLCEQTSLSRSPERLAVKLLIRNCANRTAQNYSKISHVGISRIGHVAHHLLRRGKSCDASTREGKSHPVHLKGDYRGWLSVEDLRCDALRFKIRKIVSD